MNTLALPRPVPPGRIRLVDLRRRSLLIARLRVLFVSVAFFLIALAALLRIAWIGVVQPAPAHRDMAAALLPNRGEITDRNGVPLARAFPAYALWFNPEAMDDGGAPLVKSASTVASELKAIFPDLDAYEVAQKLASGQPGYLRRRVLPDDANKVLQIGELALELPRESDRHYPQGSLAAHVLGYVGSDGVGQVGMEQVLDGHLTDPATRGRPAALSIDIRVQGALEDELKRGMLAVDAVGAAGLVLDVDTGEVLAMASLPEFDPNRVTSADVAVTPEQHARGAVAPAFNRVTNQVYELGSTFKPLTVAAAIDAGKITDLSRRWQASRPVAMGGFRISDSHTIGAWLNAPQTLIHSSNIVTAQIADELGPATLKRYMERLGMNERPYIELPARGFPIWPSGEWPRLRAMTVGYGHGIAVTPLHLASAYAAMVNGGIWRPATLHKLDPGEAPRGRRVFKASTSARMNQLMRMISVYGTGRNANAPGFRVGGKTGSAEKPGAGGYRRSSLVSTFAAAFPMDRPRYVVIAMLDEPKGTAASSFQRTAAWNAAPIVGKLIPRIGPQLGVLPDTHRDIDLSDVLPLIGEGGGALMKLAQIAATLGQDAGPAGEQPVTGFAIDHRKVAPGTVFGAFEGLTVNGEDFIPAAVSAGAIAVVARPQAKVEGALHLADPQPRRAFAQAAARFFTPVPATVVAVTGTNGKTSTVEMTRQIWRMGGLRAASIGTLGVTTPDESVSTGLTTPDIVTFLSNMTGLAREGVTHVAYEASSHGLSQFRNEGLPVRAGAFTNLSRDHLDYHSDMDDYFAAKMRLFAEVVDEGGTAVIWADDEWSVRAIDAARRRGLALFTVGERGLDLKLVSRQPTHLGQDLEIELGGERHAIRLPLIGAYQAANALVAAGLALATGSSAAQVVDALGRLQPVRGRLERAAIARSGAPVYVDYAHTPDALSAAIAALRPHVKGRLITVFGAGGDRDTGKRAAMGAAVAADSDLVIVTDDNPRGEDPAAIRAAVLEGAARAREVGDRRQAIAAAIAEAGRDDIVLVAGKGHEQGQIVGRGDDMRVLPFDDVAVARECAAQVADAAGPAA